MVLGLATVVVGCGCFGAMLSRNEEPDLRGVRIPCTYIFHSYEVLGAR
jgi:hypothetical protein